VLAQSSAGGVARRPSDVDYRLWWRTVEREAREEVKVDALSLL
jgi:hypothetical protein